MNLILIGPQGSGKGTQARLLLEKFHLSHIEIGSLIRASSQGDQPKAQIIDHLVNQKGQLLPDGVVLDLLIDHLDSIGYQNHLFDGFPRTLVQYTSLKDLLRQQNTKLHGAINISISDQEALKRLSSRRICPSCSKTYSLQIDPERSTCDCGATLTSRPDDQPDAISHRLAAYHESTQPVLEALKKDHLLIDIKGEQSVDKVTSQILDHLNSIIS